MKKIKNVLLVQMTTSKWYANKKNYKLTRIPPIGILSISSYLRMNGFPNTRVIDFSANRSENSVTYTRDTYRDIIVKNDIDVVGISVYAESYRHALELAKFTSEINPKIKILVGGAFATFTADEFLGNEYIDFAVIGEGEVTMLELMLHFNYPDQFPLAAIKGLAFKNEQGKVQINPRRNPIKNLDVLPLYDRAQDNSDYYEPSINSSRGCPGNCIYCSSRAMWGKKYRRRSSESVFSEIYYLHKKHGEISKLNFAEDTFTASPARVRAICRMIKAAGIKLKFWCESRVDVLTKDLLKEMQEAGLLSVQIGIESGVQEIIDSINKNITLEKVEQVLQWIKELGIYRVHCGFMIGHPLDTHETVQRTIDFANYIQKEYGASVEVGINTPFPGTFEFDHADELGLKIHTYDWNQYVLYQGIMDTKHLTRDDLHRYVLKFREKNRPVQTT
ncbi:radical SAM protein [candidate division KSB1 bacterium]|nr:radical SAM protein [candidate division KSB1 bacterium]